MHLLRSQYRIVAAELDHNATCHLKEHGTLKDLIEIFATNNRSMLQQQNRVVMIEVGKNEIKITSINRVEVNIRIYKVVYHTNKGKELIIPST